MIIANRQPVFDLIKAIAIYMVILGHTIQHYCPLPSNDVVLYKFIYLFHMPLFMAISGYFSASSYQLNIGDFFQKKAKTLLVPVLTFALIMTLWFAYLEHRFNMGFTDYIASYWDNVNTWLWFLRSLFLCYTATYIVLKILNNDRYKWTALMLVAVCSFPISYCNLGQMLPCFMFGLWLRENDILNRLSGINYSTPSFALISLLLLTVLNISSIYLYLFSILKLLIGLSITTFIILSLYRNREIIFVSKASNTLEHVGRRTLEIYVLQCFIVEIITPIFLKVPYYPFLSETLLYPLMAASFLGVMLVAENILAQIPIIHKFLFGK